MPIHCQVCNDTKVMFQQGSVAYPCLCCNGTFKSTKVPTPPMLQGMIGSGLPERSPRFFALYYYGTQATWIDGSMSCGFSFFGIYSPLTDHLAIQIAVLEAGVSACLGADDADPTHALLCDNQGQMYVGEMREVQNFLRLMSQNLPSAQPVVEQLMAQFEAAQTPSDFHGFGMFEMFGARVTDGANDLANYLDGFINQNLLRRYRQCQHPYAEYYAFSLQKVLKGL